MPIQRAGTWTLLALLCPLVTAEDFLPSSALNEIGLTRHWQLTLQLAPDQTLTDLFLADDQLYAITNDGYAFAVHAETGAARWMRQVTREGYPIRRPAHSGDRTIFATTAALMQVNRYTGEGIDFMPLGYPGGTAPVCDGPRMFIGGLDRRVYAYEVRNPLMRWRVIGTAPILSTPALHAGSVYFADENGSVFCCAAYNKAFRWQSFTYGAVTADLAANEDGVFVPSRDQSLYVFDLMFGRVRWQARFGGPLYEPPVLTAQTAYQYCAADGLTALNTDALVDERVRWKNPRGRRLITVDDQAALVMTVDGALLALRLDDGQLLGEIALGELRLGPPSPGNTAVHLAAPDGRLFCARPRGTPVVTRDDVRRALAAPGETTEATSAPAAEPEAQAARQPPEAPARPPLGGKSKVSKELEQGQR